MNIKKTLLKLKNSSLLSNMLIVGSITLIIKVLGFFKEIIIAEAFGLSEILDTFFIAFLIPSFISFVFLGAFKSVFIPNYVTELNTTKNIGSFQSTSFIITLATVSFFAIIAILFTDVYLEVFFSGHTPQYYALVKIQFYWILPCVIIWGVSSLIKGLLTIDNEFTYSSLSAIFTPISIIICLVFFKDYLGVKVLAIGTLLGTIMGFIFTLSVALKRGVLKLSKPDFKSDNIIILFKQIPAKLTSGILSGINPLVDQFFSAQLVVGSIAALNFGVKIPAFAIGIIAVAINNVFLPYFSKSAVKDRKKAFKKLNTIINTILPLALIVVIILILFSQPIVRLIFERNEFTSEDSIVVSKIQQMYLLQVPFYLSSLVLVKFLTSINKNSFMAFASLINLFLNIILNFILIKYLKIYGLALATSIVVFVNFIVLYIYARHLRKEI